MLMLLDTSINMAMQPFKMMVGDMVNEKQKTTAYSIQSFLCNAGSVVGFLFPFLFATFGISGTAPTGVVPDTVKYAFYIGAAILIICVIYTSIMVKEYPPKEYNEYHPVDPKEHEDEPGMLELLKKAPSTFWTVGLVQFFCWAAFMYMWTYTNGTVAHGAFDAPTKITEAGAVVLDTASQQYQDAGNWVGLYKASHLSPRRPFLVAPQIKTHQNINTHETQFQNPLPHRMGRVHRCDDCRQSGSPRHHRRRNLGRFHRR